MQKIKTWVPWIILTVIVLVPVVTYAATVTGVLGGGCDTPCPHN